MKRREAIELLIKLGFLHQSMLDAFAYTPISKRVVIVGAGTAGLISAALLRHYAKELRITLIAPNKKHLYQSAQVYVAAGVLPPSAMSRQTAQFLNNMEWIQESVVAFEAQKNHLVTSSGKKISYDILLLAMGMEYDYSQLEGLSRELLYTQKTISSVFENNTLQGTANGALLTRKWFENVLLSARHKPTRVLFCNPSGTIKCGGAVLSTLYLLADAAKGNGTFGTKDVSNNLQITLLKPGKKLFGIERYNKMLLANSQLYGNITHRFSHAPLRLNATEKTVEFLHTTRVKESYDPDFEEWSYTQKSEQITLRYDFLHITPPMRAPKILQECDLAKKSGTKKGYADVDMQTLAHKKFKNIFAIGDCAGIPLGKTAIAARFQAQTAVANILATLSGNKLTLYDGYSGCPIKLSYNDVLFTEFNYEGAVSRILRFEKKARDFRWHYDLHEVPKRYWQCLRGEFSSS